MKKNEDETWIGIFFGYLAIGVFSILATIFSGLMALFTLPARTPELWNKFVRWCRENF